MYQHPIIQKAVNVMWFQNKRDEGIQFRNMFKPMPIAAIALVLTAVRIIKLKWDSGAKLSVRSRQTLMSGSQESEYP